MNKGFAISLLFLLLFHQLGYYFFYVASKHQINRSWEEKLQNQLLREQDFNHMALPLSIPYQIDQEVYETTNEALEFSGKFYRVIKKRYANDTLHIIYVDDIRTQRLKNSFKDWINSVYQEKNPDSKRQIVLTSFEKNFFANAFVVSIIEPEPFILEYNEFYSLGYCYQYVNALEHPPKVLSIS